MERDKLFTTTDIAKEYQITARDLNRLLVNEKIITKRDGHYDLTTSHKKKGLEKIIFTSFMRSDGTPDESRTMKWTQTGKYFIENVLDAKGFMKGV